MDTIETLVNRNVNELKAHVVGFIDSSGAKFVTSRYPYGEAEPVVNLRDAMTVLRQVVADCEKLMGGSAPANTASAGQKD